MKSTTLLSLVSLSLVQALPAPAPVPQVTYNSDPASIPTNRVNPPGIPEAKGHLRGSAKLLGYNKNNDVEQDTTVIPPSDFELAPGQTDDPDLGLYLDLESVNNPQPIRGNAKAPTDPGPRTYQYEAMNPDLYAPPGTDSGSVPQAVWPMGLSHNRHGSTPSAGFSRQQNIQQLSSATAMAGVDMRLSPWAYRELHWHKANEWAYIFNGTVRVSAINDVGETFNDDLKAGDVWFFPAGYPHSIQAGEQGSEFLLVFDQGDFSDDNTFLVSEMFERNPKSVLAKDLRTDVSAFDNLPDGQLYIFPGTPYPKDINDPTQNVTGPAGPIPVGQTFSYHFSEQEPYSVPGGTVKIIDPLSFPIADNFAVALVTIEPGAMRQLHWHPTSDEWDFILYGQGRITLYAAPQSSGTFDFTSGDVAYVPVPEPHYIENTGNETLVYLEVLQAPRFQDVSVAQWLGLTPPQIVKDTLHLPDDVIARLPKENSLIVPGNPNLLTTNFTEEAP